MKTLTLALVAALVAHPAAAQVGPYNQVPRDRAEKAIDRSQVRGDVASQQADAAGLSRLKSIQTSYATAASARDPAAVTALDQQLLGALEAEIAESSRELQLKQAEVAQDASENRSNRRETRTDLAYGRPVADDAKDRARDVANTGKDVGDTKGEAAALARKQELRAAYAPLSGRVDDASLSRKTAMIGDLVAMANAEVAEGGQETREDLRELREDRREKREDIHRR